MKFCFVLYIISFVLVIYSSRVYSVGYNLKFESSCTITYQEKDGKKNVILADFKYVIKNKRGGYVEMLSCASRLCHSERIYLKDQEEIVSAFKYAGEISREEFNGDLLSFIYEGSDTIHKRKIQINTKTGDISFYEFGKTIGSKKDFHEADTSKCEKLKFNRMN